MLNDHMVHYYLDESRIFFVTRRKNATGNECLKYKSMERWTTVHVDCIAITVKWSHKAHKPLDLKL